MDNLNFGNITVAKQTWKSGDCYSYESNARPYCGICFVVSGKISYKTKNGIVTAAEGDVVVLKKHARYKAIFGKEPTCDILVNFRCEPFGSESEFFVEFKEQIIVFKNILYLKKSFFDILGYFVSEKSLLVKAELYKILDKICTSKEENNPYYKIKSVIDSDLDFSMKEEQIAEKCAMSVSSLQRHFKATYGKTVSEYRAEMKISKAKELLTSGAHTLEEIAEILGFCDSSYFGKCFKKHEGMSPKKYLKEYYTM